MRIFNLVEHVEQYDPAECLTRHARKLGLAKPEHLVRAWKAGYVYLILDGFDGLTPRIATRDLKRAKDVRRIAVELVSRFARETPARSPIAIAGRSNFFDSKEDLINALRIIKDWSMYKITDFNEPQTDEVFKGRNTLDKHCQHGCPGGHYLLDIYLSRELLDAAFSAELLDDVNAGWDYLIQRIAEREINQVYLALDAGELREVYGRIATKCRKRAARLGPITYQDCKDAFVEILQIEPEGRSVTALLRLPGLVAGHASDLLEGGTAGARYFVDEAFADAVASIDVGKFIMEPNKDKLALFQGVRHALGEIGTGVALLHVGDELRRGKVAGALERVLNIDDTNPISVDLVQCLNDWDLDCPKMQIIRNVSSSNLRLDADSGSLNAIMFAECYFDEVIIMVDDVKMIPRFQHCAIERLRTQMDIAELTFVIDETTYVESLIPLYERFSDYKRVAEDDRLIALGTVLQKLFIQSGTGRLESALPRGLTQIQASYVPGIVDLLTRHGFIKLKTRGTRRIWYPISAAKLRAESILKNPDASKDQLVKELVDS
jgi:hypothetical protein